MLRLGENSCQGLERSGRPGAYCGRRSRPLQLLRRMLRSKTCAGVRRSRKESRRLSGGHDMKRRGAHRHAKHTRMLNQCDSRKTARTPEIGKNFCGWARVIHQRSCENIPRRLHHSRWDQPTKSKSGTSSLHEDKHWAVGQGCARHLCFDQPLALLIPMHTNLWVEGC